MLCDAMRLQLELSSLKVTFHVGFRPRPDYPLPFCTYLMYSLSTAGLLYKYIQCISPSVHPAAADTDCSSNFTS